MLKTDGKVIRHHYLESLRNYCLFLIEHKRQFSNIEPIRDFYEFDLDTKRAYTRYRSTLAEYGEKQMFHRYHMENSQQFRDTNPNRKMESLYPLIAKLEGDKLNQLKDLLQKI